jgi:hypothetical protein
MAVQSLAEEATQIAELTETLRSAMSWLQRHLQAVFKQNATTAQDLKNSMLAGLDFTVFNNDEIKTLFAEAIAAHKEWLKQIDETISSKGVWTAIIDPHYCQFGLFYDVSSPRDQYKDLWPRFGELNERLHNTADQLKKAYEDGNQELVVSLRKNLESNSKELITLMEQIEERF